MATALSGTDHDYLTTEEVGRELRACSATVIRWIKHGVLAGGRKVHLEAFRVGQEWRIPRDAPGAFVRACNDRAPVVLASELRRQRAEAEAASRRLEERLGRKRG